MTAAAKPLLRIKDWTEFLPYDKTRKNASEKGALGHYKQPTKHDSCGIRNVSKHPHSAAVYGCWILMVQVAAKCQPRGTLRGRDGALDASDLAGRTGFPEKYFREAIEVLLDPKIGWLELVGSEEAQSLTPANVASNRTFPESSVRERKDTGVDENHRNRTENSGYPSVVQSSVIKTPLPPKGGAGAWEQIVASLSPELKTPAFETAWREWIDYGKDSKKKLTAASVSKQLKLLEELGHDRAITSIDASIRNGWAGLFEPDKGRAGNTTSKGGEANRPGRMEAKPGKYDRFRKANQVEPGVLHENAEGPAMALRIAEDGTRSAAGDGVLARSAAGGGSR